MKIVEFSVCIYCQSERNSSRNIHAFVIYYGLGPFWPSYCRYAAYMEKYTADIPYTVDALKYI